MKRSEINEAYREARECFRKYCWHLPPNAKWDITDFGLGDFETHGLTLINLADEPEYCEKLMYARLDQKTPCHTHAKKKEDIICRAGTLTLWLWAKQPSRTNTATGETVSISMNGVSTVLPAGEPCELPAGHRVTIVPGIWHAFAPSSKQCIIGEVSTANDDLHDNFFLDPEIGRFPGIAEDEPSQIRLLSE